MKKEDSPFAPDMRAAGEKSIEGTDAVFTWFGPEGEAFTRHRYAVIKEEAGVLSIQPGEGRFKKGLKAIRYTDEKTEDGAVYRVLKTRPNRIDLKPE